MSARAPSPQRLHQLAGQMARYREDMLRELCALCAIPSVRGAPSADAPYGAATRQVLLHFLELGEKLGFSAVNLDNRAGYVEFGQGDHLVAGLCHLDVVPAGAGWVTGPFAPVIQDGRIIARGVSDNKGPAIAVLYAMKDLMDSGFCPRGRIRLIVGLDEENGSSCMAHYVRVAETPQAGFTPDASFPVIYAEKGICWLRFKYRGGQTAQDELRLTAARGGDAPNMIPGRCSLSFTASGGRATEESVEGRMGHASMPWLGENAISRAMGTAARRLAASGCSHPFVRFYQEAIGSSWKGEGLGIAMADESGPLTCNAGRLELDEQGAVLTADIRYPVSRSLAQILTAIRQKAAPHGVKVEVINAVAPLFLPRDSFLVKTLNDVYTEQTGLEAAPVAIGGGTYARTMPNVVAFGGSFPEDPETAHQAGEYLETEKLLATAAIYREALRTLALPDR